ncbi:MAG TPA: dihydrodipicolinate synthase family protein [Gaiellales bacterium]|jgi:4-hydroxy-tetrahydrodipicolinate synthase|nr:dihydrodipicolinate synthase family protein [Gaiellales bacterium]
MPLLLAASVTPLTAAAQAVDEQAIGPLVAYLEAGGVDGVFACGTTGEGVLLADDERRRAAVRFREACGGTLIVHCGAQTTAATVGLAAHAAEIGADGAAMIPPPYFQLDDAALVEHAVAAAAACAPLPFYLYAFSARSGYPLPPAVVAAVAGRAENLAGLKVSEPSMEAVSPYLGLGLPVLVGSEPLIPDALAAGAAGAVSGLASAFPAEVAAVVRDPTPEGAARVRRLREALGTTTLIAAAKYVLGRRGVPVGPDVRPPLRGLTASEQDALTAI